MSVPRKICFGCALLLAATFATLLGFLIFDPGPNTSGTPAGVYSVGAVTVLYWLAYFGSKA